MNKTSETNDNAIDIETSGQTADAGDVRVVTIAGKQVQIKYETLPYNYDIYGLHAKQRRRRTKDGRDGKSRAERNSVDDMHACSPLSPDDNAVRNARQTNGGSTKLLRIMKRFESDERSVNKNLTIDKIIGDKLKKEPIKMENRFDMLLANSSGDDASKGGENSSVSTAANTKKKRKTKSKIANSLSANNNDEVNDNNERNDYNPNNGYNNSENFDAHNELFAQKVIVVQNNNTIASIYDNENSISNNSNINNSGNNNKGGNDRKDNKEGIETPETNGTPKGDNELDGQPDCDHDEQAYDHNEEVGKRVDDKDEESKVKKRVTKHDVKHDVRHDAKHDMQERYANGGVITRDDSLPDNTKQLIVQDLDQNKTKSVLRSDRCARQLWPLEARYRWPLYALMGFAFLVMYALIVLNQFCDCGRQSAQDCSARVPNLGVTTNL